MGAAHRVRGDPRVPGEVRQKAQSHQGVYPESHQDVSPGTRDATTAQQVLLQHFSNQEQSPRI